MMMLTPDVVEFVMDGVVAGRIPRAVARMVMGTYVVGDLPVSSPLALAGAEVLHGFAMTVEQFELRLPEDDFLQFVLSFPDRVTWEIADDQVRERVDKWKALRQRVGDNGRYDFVEEDWVPGSEQATS